MPLLKSVVTLVAGFAFADLVDFFFRHRQQTNWRRSPTVYVVCMCLHVCVCVKGKFISNVNTTFSIFSDIGHWFPERLMWQERMVCREVTGGGGRAGQAGETEPCTALAHSLTWLWSPANGKYCKYSFMPDIYLWMFSVHLSVCLNCGYVVKGLLNSCKRYVHV